MRVLWRFQFLKSILDPLHQLSNADGFLNSLDCLHGARVSDEAELAFDDLTFCGRCVQLSVDLSKSLLLAHSPPARYN